MMANIVDIMSPSGDKTGRRVLFITHKEYSEWSGIHFWSRRKRLVYFPVLLAKKIKAFIIMGMIRRSGSWNNYVKIVHWGFSIPNAVHIPDLADLHMCDKDTAQGIINTDGKLITITSKDFTPPPDIYPQSENNFKWDIVSVSHNSRRKRLDILMRTIRAVLDEKPSLTAMILINTPSSEYRRTTVSSDVGFLKYYYMNFDYRERQQICLLRVSDEQALEGASPGFVTWVLSNARIFLLCSEREGSAKVIKEATDSGCHAFVWKHLKGGTTTNIDSDKFTEYANEKELKGMILEKINCADDHINRTIERFYFNRPSITKLETCLRNKGIISRNDSFDEKQFEFANRWLPAHHDLSEGSVTNDITSLRSVITLLRGLD
jgi:hypothetical protein